jgi:MFS family permease
MLRAFRYRNYRIFFIGQSVSLTGTWMQQLALGWLVYRLTGSVMLLGVVGFAAQIPSLLLSPLAGALADRYDRRRLLIATQALAMLQALAMALLVLTGAVRVLHIVALSAVLGVVNAFDMPIRHAFIADIITRKEDFGNAIALNSFMFNGTRLIGPTLAGFLVATAGEGVCFMINAVSYLAVIVSLTLISGRRRRLTPVAPVLEELKEGFLYTFRSPPIRAVIALVAVISLVGMPYGILMPVFARDILGGGAHTLGFLTAAVGLGALAGAVYLASRPALAGIGKTIARMTALFGGGIIAFSFSRTLWLSLALLLAAGFGAMVLLASCNTVVQTVVEDDKRGRVMSLYTSAFMGIIPFGSLLAGFTAQRIGADRAMLIGGSVCLLIALIFGAGISLRPKLIDKGEKVGLVDG